MINHKAVLAPQPSFLPKMISLVHLHQDIVTFFMSQASDAGGKKDSSHLGCVWFVLSGVC